MALGKSREMWFEEELAIVVRIGSTGNNVAQDGRKISTADARNIARFVSVEDMGLHIARRGRMAD